MIQVSEEDIEIALKGKGILVLQKSTIVLYGCTVYMGRICSRLLGHNITASAVIDNDEKRQGTKYFGLSVYAPQSYLLPYDANKIIIVCSMHEKEMLESLCELGYSNENVLHIKIGIDDGMNFLMQRMDTIRKGIGVYDSILEEYGCTSTVAIMPCASGDAFIACSYFKAWCKSSNIENYVIVCAGTNMADIAHLYCLNPVKLVSVQDRESLVAAYMFYGQHISIKLLSPWEMRIANSFFGTKDAPISFTDKFVYEVFGMSKDAVPDEAQFGASNDFHEWESEAQKILVIAPYGYSSPSPVIPIWVWEGLAKEFIDKGYIVYTVAYGKNEIPIGNTQTLRFSYYDSMRILKRAGNFIGVRNGLCDIIHAAQCKKLIIYKGSQSDVAAKSDMRFFGLKNLFFDFCGEEVMYGDFTEQGFVEFVVNYFERDNTR